MNVSCFGVASESLMILVYAHSAECQLLARDSVEEEAQARATLVRGNLGRKLASLRLTPEDMANGVTIGVAEHNFIRQQRALPVQPLGRVNGGRSHGGG